MSTSWDTCISGLAAAILHFRLPLTLDNILLSAIELAILENMVGALEFGQTLAQRHSSLTGAAEEVEDYRPMSRYVVFTRPGLCPVFIDVSGVCPLYVRGMSDVCPPNGESRMQRRTVRRTVRRTEGVAIIARDMMTYIVIT